MARVSAATPGRSVTTYKSGKNGSASRRPGSTLKKTIIQPSPRTKHTKASKAIKTSKAPAAASSESDESSTDESDSGESGSDGEEGEEEEFDPKLRNLVHQCECPLGIGQGYPADALVPLKLD